MTPAITTHPQRNPMRDRTRSTWPALALAVFTATAVAASAQTLDVKSRPAACPRSRTRRALGL